MNTLEPKIPETTKEMATLAVKVTIGAIGLLKPQTPDQIAMVEKVASMAIEAALERHIQIVFEKAAEKAQEATGGAR